jgi:hypothetical protein
MTSWVDASSDSFDRQPGGTSLPGCASTAIFPGGSPVHEDYLFFGVTGGAGSHRLATQRNHASPTAGGDYLALQLVVQVSIVGFEEKGGVLTMQDWEPATWADGRQWLLIRPVAI